MNVYVNVAVNVGVDVGVDVAVDVAVDVTVDVAVDVVDVNAAVYPPGHVPGRNCFVSSHWLKKTSPESPARDRHVC